MSSAVVRHSGAATLDLPLHQDRGGSGVTDQSGRNVRQAVLRRPIGWIADQVEADTVAVSISCNRLEAN